MCHAASWLLAVEATASATLATMLDSQLSFPGEQLALAVPDTSF